MMWKIERIHLDLMPVYVSNDLVSVQEKLNEVISNYNDLLDHVKYLEQEIESAHDRIYDLDRRS